MMKRFFLFIALSIFYSTAMVVVGGYNVSSDAAQLWNTQKKNADQDSEPSYYNSQTHSNKSGKPTLYNSQKGRIGREVGNRSDSMRHQYLRRSNDERAGDRPPAIFKYMSANAVANRLNDIEAAVQRRDQRMKQTRALLAKYSKEDLKRDEEIRLKNRKKIALKVFGRVFASKTNKRSSSKMASRKDTTTRSETSSTTTSFTAGGYFNRSGGSSADSSKKTTLFNSSN